MPTKKSNNSKTNAIKSPSKHTPANKQPDKEVNDLEVTIHGTPEQIEAVEKEIKEVVEPVRAVKPRKILANKRQELNMDNIGRYGTHPFTIKEKIIKSLEDGNIVLQKIDRDDKYLIRVLSTDEPITNITNVVKDSYSNSDDFLNKIAFAYNRLSLFEKIKEYFNVAQYDLSISYFDVIDTINDILSTLNTDQHKEINEWILSTLPEYYIIKTIDDVTVAYAKLYNTETKSPLTNSILSSNQIFHCIRLDSNHIKNTIVTLDKNEDSEEYFSRLDETVDVVQNKTDNTVKSDFSKSEEANNYGLSMMSPYYNPNRLERELVDSFEVENVKVNKYSIKDENEYILDIIVNNNVAETQNIVKDATTEGKEFLEKVAAVYNRIPLIKKLEEYADTSRIHDTAKARNIPNALLNNIIDDIIESLNFADRREIYEWIISTLPEYYTVLNSNGITIAYTYLYDTTNQYLSTSSIQDRICHVIQLGPQKDYYVNRLSYLNKNEDIDKYFNKIIVTRFTNEYNRYLKLINYYPKLDKHLTDLTTLSFIEMEELDDELSAKLSCVKVIKTTPVYNQIDNLNTLLSVGSFSKRVHLSYIDDIQRLDTKYEFYKEVQNKTLDTLEGLTACIYSQHSSRFKDMYDNRYKYSDVEIEKEIEKIAYLLEETKEVETDFGYDNNSITSKRITIKSLCYSKEINATKEISSEDLLKLKFMLKLEAISRKPANILLGYISKCPFDISELADFEYTKFNALPKFPSSMSLTYPTNI